MQSIPIDEFYGTARSLLDQDPIKAAEYVIAKRDEVDLDEDPFSDLFSATIFKSAREKLYQTMGIEFKDCLHDDLDSLVKYCENEKIGLTLRLYEITKKQNALGTGGILDSPLIEKLALAFLPVMKKMKDIGNREDEINTDGSEGWKASIKITVNDDADKIEYQKSPETLDQLLCIFAAERTSIALFEKKMNEPDTNLNSLNIDSLNNNGVLIYESNNDDFNEVVGPLVFVPTRNGRGNKMLHEFYQSVMGADNAVTPIAIWDDRFNVFKYETCDQEVLLENPQISKKEKYFSILTNLMKQAEFSERLEDHYEMRDNGVMLQVKHFEGFIDLKFGFTQIPHDFEKEMINSAITGRDGENYRLARENECEVIEGKRVYVRETNESIERLIFEVEGFKELLDMPSLEKLYCFHNQDAQPSNFFVNGKLHDLDRIKYGNPLYMTARLLSHPSVTDFLETLTETEKREFTQEFVKESDSFSVKQAGNIMFENEELIDGDYAFMLYAARGAKEELPGLATDMKLSHNAHKAWISMYHVMTYMGRIGDTTTAKRYLDNAITFLSQPEFSEIKDAYVSAINQSEYAMLL